MNFISAVFILFVSLCFNLQISQSYKSDRITKILHTFNADCLWAKFDFRTLFIIPKTYKTLHIFAVSSFPLHIFYTPSSRDPIHLFCFSIVCCSFASTGTRPLNAISLDFSVAIFIPNCFVVLCKVFNALCESSSESDHSTCPSADNSVLRIVSSFLSVHLQGIWSQ
jgi:hypothetical protein